MALHLSYWETEGVNGFLLVHLSTTNVCERRRPWRDRDRADTQRNNQSGCPHRQEWQHRLTKKTEENKNCASNSRVYLNGQTSVWIWTISWMTGGWDRKSDTSTSQVASNVLKIFTCLMWPYCNLTKLKIRSPALTPGIDISSFDLLGYPCCFGILCHSFPAMERNDGKSRWLL